MKALQSIALLVNGCFCLCLLGGLGYAAYHRPAVVAKGAALVASVTYAASKSEN